MCHMSGKGELFAWNPSFQGHTLLISDCGLRLTYGEAQQIGEEITERMKPRSLMLILCSNTPGFVLIYLNAIRAGMVPLLLDAKSSREDYQRIAGIYQPDYVAAPEGSLSGAAIYQGYGYQICAGEGIVSQPMNPELALLLTTSGSTGSAKLVRQSYRNLQSNAEAIASYLQIGADERPITTLPMHYTYGLSILHSHALRGACLLLTDAGVTEARFWEFLQKERATSFGGVPATYEILERLGFWGMDLPSLRTMTQAGGKLSCRLQEEFCRHARKKGQRFFVMYGQTEATARMSYLPWEVAERKPGSIGLPIPGGSFSLLGEDGQWMEGSGRSGELVYKGENVALGYAECRKDLEKGDEWGGRLLTGDLACRDEDGFYYITGRKKRFLKISGKRISLDEVESLLKDYAPGLEAACTGQDDRLKVFYTAPKSRDEELMCYLAEKLCIQWRAVELHRMAELPRNTAGKIQYYKLV